VTYINTDEHGLLRDLFTEGHAPKISSKLGIHLTNDVEENAIIVLGNSAVCHKLRNHWTVTVNLVLQERVEVLMVGMVWHDDKENKVGVLDSAVRGLNGRQDLLVVVVLNA